MRIIELQVGAYGCAVFALRDALEELGYRYDPIEFIALLKKHGILEASGRLNLNKLELLGIGLTSERCRPGNPCFPRRERVIDAARRLTGEGALVLVQFPSKESVHWVFLSPHPGSDGGTMFRDSKWGATAIAEGYDLDRISGLVIIRKIPALPPVHVASAQ